LAFHRVFSFPWFPPLVDRHYYARLAREMQIFSGGVAICPQSGDFGFRVSL
jgi:hypothetical protein